MKMYRPTIGIECHVQLKTKTKLFSAVSNEASEAMPNTLISHIDMGLPGALPVVNFKAIQLAIRAAAALNTKAQKVSIFDRKHYFYPDLPMGYQITQFYHPIIKGGRVELKIKNKLKNIRIKEAHLEADAGKSTHPDSGDFSYVDLNRAGTPLLEIVSEPDISSAEEARAYARELWLIMKYASVSDADLFQGNMRFDVNVSVSTDQTLGTRTETKNLNSFKSVEKAVEYEIKRQSEQLNKGLDVVQETRGWDESKQKTYSMRSKEDAHDYRYMPDPDLPPIVIDESLLKQALHPSVENPSQIREALASNGINNEVSESLIEKIEVGLFLKELINENLNPAELKKIVDWFASDIQAKVIEDQLKWSELKYSIVNFRKLYSLTKDNKISSTAAKQVLFDMIVTGKDPEEISKSNNLFQISDTTDLKEIVLAAIKENPKAAEDIKAGEGKAIGFLVGQVMAKTKGQANPTVVAKLITEGIFNGKNS
jgi:aspartyl-tRNA(Asn)/glutamyl-tRNA(Gln) amidotransferase subunit B